MLLLRRLVRPPIKFGSEEEPQPDKAAAPGAPNADPKRDHAKRPVPESIAPAGTTALDDGQGQDPNSNTSARRNFVAPAPVSRALSPESVDVASAAAASTTTAPGAGAGAAAAAAPASVAAVSSAATAAAAVDVPRPRVSAAQLNALPVKRKRNIRTIRFRGGGLPPASTAAPSALPAAAAAAAPFSREAEDNAATSDLFAATADAGAVISPKDKISAAATVAKKAVDSLFDTAALQLSSATAVAAAAAASRAAGDQQGKPVIHAGAAAASARGAQVSKPKAKAAAAVAVERLLPFGAEVTAGVTARDIVDAACSRSWFGRAGAAEEGPRGALTGVLATAQVLMEKVSKSALMYV